MNYVNIYNLFVEKFKNQELLDGYEIHHIVPRHAGGDDSSENLVKVTYHQHRFLHKVRYKAYGQKGDLLAYKLMYGTKEDALFIIRSHAGKIGGEVNVESGHISKLGKIYGPITGNSVYQKEHLSKIRCDAHTDKQKEHLKRLCEYNVVSGHLDRIRQLVDKDKLRESSRINGNKSVETGQIHKMQVKAAELKLKAAEEFSKQVIEQAERNVEFLQKYSQADRYTYTSPEEIEFPSAKSAAGYYGKISYKVITRWAKDSRYGWRRVPKRNNSNDVV